MTDEPRAPLYRELPIAPGSDQRCAWGIFGGTDRVGTLNRTEPGHIRHAAELVRDGRVFSLNWSMALPSPAILGRKTMDHTVIHQTAGLDDRFDSFYPQQSSQWDALSHVRHPDAGFYNGHAAEDVNGTRDGRLGIHNWAQRGIAGRFVLVDLARAGEKSGEPIDCAARCVVDVAQLETAFAQQEVRLQMGDILLLHFGWTRWYEQLGEDERTSLADADLFPSPGIENSEEMASWLWDAGVAAVAADTPALEAMPFDIPDPRGFLHYRLIPLLGLAVGEMFDLAALADDCARDARYDGLFTAAPLNIPGSSGSPANAIVIK